MDFFLSLLMVKSFLVFILPWTFIFIWLFYFKHSIFYFHYPSFLLLIDQEYIYPAILLKIYSYILFSFDFMCAKLVFLILINIFFCHFFSTKKVVFGQIFRNNIFIYLILSNEVFY